MTRANVSITFADPAMAEAVDRYRTTHDTRDLATLPCRYGCQDPATCPWPHGGCRHCTAVRTGVAVTPSVPDGH